MACGAGPPGAPKNKGLMPEPLEPLPLPCATNTPTHQHTAPCVPIKHDRAIGIYSPPTAVGRYASRRQQCAQENFLAGSQTDSGGADLDLRECYREVPERRFDRRTITASNHDLGSLGDCRGTLLARRVAIFERNINPGAAGGMGSETK